MQLDFTTLLSPDASLWQSPLLPDRFWSKVNPAGPVPPHCPEIGQCWVWTAGCNPDGYGHCTVGSRTDGTRRMVLSHRHLYAALVMPIPEGQLVCHHCDNPPCVRPGHLFLGTNADNQLDMTRKGRRNAARGERNGSVTHPESRPRGERIGKAKLTEAEVLEIRALARQGLSLRAIARQFRVGNTTVWQIIRRVTWRHV